MSESPMNPQLQQPQSKIMLRNTANSKLLFFTTANDIDPDNVREEAGAGIYELWRYGGTSEITVVPEKTRMKFQSAVKRSGGPRKRKTANPTEKKK